MISDEVTVDGRRLRGKMQGLWQTSRLRAGCPGVPKDYPLLQRST